MEALDNEKRCHEDFAVCTAARTQHASIKYDVEQLVLANNEAWMNMNNAFMSGNRAAATPFLMDYQNSHIALIEGWDKADIALAEMETACHQFGEMECQIPQ